MGKRSIMLVHDSSGLAIIIVVTSRQGSLVPVHGDCKKMR